MDARDPSLRRILAIRALAAFVVLVGLLIGRDLDAATKCFCTERQRTVWDLSDRGCDAVCDGPGIPARELEPRDEVESGGDRCYYRNRRVSCREARRLEREERSEPPVREVVCDRGHVAAPANPTAAEIARCRATRPKTRYQPR